MKPLEIPAIPAPAPAVSSASPTFRVCLATIGGELFVIDLRYVREVFPVERTTPVPRMPAAIVGVANLRGTIIPLVDVRSVLGLTDQTGAQKFAVVLKHGPQQVGLLLDDVPEVRTIAQDAILASPNQAEQAGRPFVSGVLPLEGRMGGVVEVPALLAQVEGG